MTITLTNKECAMIFKAIEAMDFSYIGEEANAEQVKAKVLPGAVEFTQQELVRKAAE